MMVSMLISLIVMGAVASVFLSSNDTFRRLQGLATIQDNGRFAISFMKGVFQGAAYSGCMTTNTIVKNQLTNPNAYANDFTVPLAGYESTGVGVWSPVLDAVFTTAPAPVPLGGNDIVTVRGAVGPAVNVQAGMAGLNAAVPISTNHYFAATNPILLVSDCGGNADIFQKTNAAAGSAAHAAGPNSSANLSRVYGPGDITVPIDTTSFYLSTINNINSLVVIQGGQALEMVRGMDGMQILYGVTTATGTGTSADTSANQYLTAQQVVASAGGWANVVSVRIAMLLSTPNLSVRQPDTRVYQLLGVPYGPFNDLRMRQQFETTISLRNRSLQ